MTTAPSSVTTPSAPPAPASPLAEQPPDAPIATEPPQTGDDATPAVQPRWLDADEQRVWQAYLSATTLLDDHLDRQLQRDAGMPHVYYGFLVQLSEAPRRRLRMTEMARAAKITRSRLSHAIARLERNGWVTREDCPSDRRGQFAVLTDQGYEVLRRTAPGHVEAVRQALFDRLTPAQQKTLGEIMEIVAEGLQPLDAGADLPWLR
ncbi:MarR family transcriptional regulator [Streptomyces uncialis]|uniref:MarR family winged helix-turn-helix transcriptional regulator n=1 Tax=Streptomyces uncialis TaxID=1048205 RepID=UPI0009A0DB3A